MLKQLLSSQNARHISYTHSNYNKMVDSRQVIRDRIEEDKQKLKWRTPMSEKPEEWYSKLKLFAPENDKNSQLITKLQQPIDVSPSGIKKWWTKKNIEKEKMMQQFIPERHEILGNDLATAHFLVHRGGSIRFTNSKVWITKDDEDNYELPNKYDPTYLVEAIKCDNMTLYYEGLENIRRLFHLKNLSFKNVKTFDDWSLDRISGSECNSLEVLDLTGTCITERGLVALCRIPSLKHLIVDFPPDSIQWNLTCAMLEEFNPKLVIDCNSPIA